MKVYFLFISILLISNINTAHASNIGNLITAEKISVSDIYSITQNTIIDDVWFKEMTYELISSENKDYNWLSGGIWWMNSSGMITMDLGNAFAVQNILIQVDAKDQYQLDYSMDNTNWSNLFTISPEDGEISYGMDTMSSDPLHSEYVASLEFDTVEAQYLRVSATGDNGLFFLAELQAFGKPLNEAHSFSQAVSPVPAPPSLMLFSAGLVILAGLQYRRKKLSFKA